MEPYINENEAVGQSYQNAVNDNDNVDYVAEYNRSTREYFEKYTNVTFTEMAGPAKLYTYCPKELAKCIIDSVE